MNTAEDTGVIERKKLGGLFGLKRKVLRLIPLPT
jgi:hypothetical protein